MSMKKLLCLALAIIMVVGVLAGCQKPVDPTTKPNVQNPTNGNNPTNKPTTPGGDPTDPTQPNYVVNPWPEGDYIWKTSVSTLAANWNPHTYQTSDDSVPLDYTTSGLYTFIFNDELHPVEGKDPYMGYVIMPEMAAEMPIDVTNEIKTQYPQFNIPADMESGYAYKIILNSDACWSDGTPITAETYVQSFERLLRPELLNYRAADWYGQTLSIAGAEYYFNQGTSQYIDDASQNKENMVKGEDGNYYTADGCPVYIAWDNEGGIAWCGGYTLKFYVDYYQTDYFDLTYYDT